MNAKLQQAMKNIGMDVLPKDIHEPLSPYGFDSLKMALLVMELERIYDLRIDLNTFCEDRFINIQTITAWITELEDEAACAS